MANIYEDGTLDKIVELVTIVSKLPEDEIQKITWISEGILLAHRPRESK